VGQRDGKKTTCFSCVSLSPFSPSLLNTKYPLSHSIHTPFRLSSYPNRGIRIGDPPSVPSRPSHYFIYPFLPLLSLLGQILAFAALSFHEYRCCTVLFLVGTPPYLVLNLSLTAHSSKKSQILILTLDGLRSSIDIILILIGSLPMCDLEYCPVICGVSPFFTAYYNAILPPTSMPHLDPGVVPSLGQTGNSTTLNASMAHTTPPGSSGTHARGTSSCRFDVLLSLLSP
jgi:hypothetical protein